MFGSISISSYIVTDPKEESSLLFNTFFLSCLDALFYEIFHLVVGELALWWFFGLFGIKGFLFTFELVLSNGFNWRGICLQLWIFLIIFVSYTIWCFESFYLSVIRASDLLSFVVELYWLLSTSFFTSRDNCFSRCFDFELCILKSML